MADVNLVTVTLQTHSFSAYLVEVETAVNEKHHLAPGCEQRDANLNFIKNIDSQNDSNQEVLKTWNPSRFPRL